jgi:hypothetical protein
MAISTELFSVYHNPEFEFNITRSGKWKSLLQEVQDLSGGG